MPSTVNEISDVSPSVTQLVTGIIADVQNLGLQHLELFRNEIKDDFRKATTGTVMLGMGIAVLQVGGFLLCLMLVHLLGLLVPALPNWACYGIVGIIVTGLGAVGVAFGINKMKSVEQLSAPAAEAIKEDAEWLTNQT